MIDHNHEFLGHRDCFIQPPECAASAADLLSEAADAVLAGNDDLAMESIIRADMEELGEFALLLTGKNNPAVHRVREVPGAPARGKGEGKRMPAIKVQRDLYVRDGWRCRFCGIRGIDPEARKILTKKFPDEARWSGGRANEHKAFQVLLLSPDHVLPYTRGGDSSLENLVAACYTCQFGRNEKTIEEVGLNDPRNREPVVDSWDGLRRLV